MIVIGEIINGTRKKVGEAIANRDEGLIRHLAKVQVDAGADYLDVNAGTHPDQEPADLVWLVRTVQGVTDVPLCLDSANPEALSAGLKAAKKRPILNSLSGERNRMDGVLPLACENRTALIVLALDDDGIPAAIEKRVEIVMRLVDMTRRGGLPDKHLFIDPLVTSLATDTDSGNRAFEAMRRIKAAVPEAHLTAGLSNISYGLPARSLINQSFVVLAMAAGLDSAIINPEDARLMSLLYATEMVLGRDRFCSGYTRAFREGRIMNS